MSESPAEALRRERELARRLLADGYAEDHIDQDELDRRLERVEHATSIAELHGLTNELRPAVTETALVPVDREAAQRLPVLFGAVERVGAWRAAALGCAPLDPGEGVLGRYLEHEGEVGLHRAGVDLADPRGVAVERLIREGGEEVAVAEDDGAAGDRWHDLAGEVIEAVGGE